MKNIREITVQDLQSTSSLNLDFKSTKELEPFHGIIGQERALASITSAMQIKHKGFNLYVSGSLGIGKTAYVLSVVNELAANETIPNDYCYIHNFEDPDKPIYITLEPGMGYELKTDMNQFVSKLLLDFSIKLAGDTYEKEKKDILTRFETMKKTLLAEFDKMTFEQGFKIKYDKDGISFSPVFNGTIIGEKEFNELGEQQKQYFKEKSPSIQDQTLMILKKLDEIDKKAKETIASWEENLATFISTQAVKDLKVKYKNNLKLQNFFYNIQSDIVKNLEVLKQYQSYLKSTEKSPVAMPSRNMPRPELPFDNYRINVIIDNDSLSHAPVVLCKNPTYYDLFGKLEFETSMNGTKTNYTMLRPGLLHKANGGYIIINVKDILSSLPTWEALKRIIRNGELSIDSSRDIPQPPNVPMIKPEAIPLNIQFVLIGSDANYMNLCKLDPDFKKLFKVKAEFEDFIEKTEDNLEKLAKYVAFVCKRYSLITFSKQAVLKVIDISSKIAGNRNKLTSNMSDICDLIIESSHEAKLKNKKLVSDQDVAVTYQTKKRRFSLYDDNLNEMIANGSVMISTDGFTVGQINGLTIVPNGDFMFGKPVRITANTFIGKSGIVNIEREVSLSGSSHSKGILILSAYIGEKYAQDFSLNFDASICFEQLYNGIDGDSASSTELYAILSSLASVPIKQNLAVTGSVNQKGEIQPIGGVSEKIEGFYNVCKNRGFNNNGVLIPRQNVENLNLNNDIIESIEKGEFHIYPISTIDEGIELLTGVKSGKLVGNSTYERGSINEKVYNKLKKYSQKTKE